MTITTSTVSPLANLGNTPTIDILECPKEFDEAVLKYMVECGYDEIFNSTLFQRTEFADSVAQSRGAVHSLSVRTSNFDLDSFLNLDGTPGAGPNCPTAPSYVETAMLARRQQFHRKYAAELASSFLLSCNAPDPLTEFFNDVSASWWVKFYGINALVQLIALFKRLIADPAALTPAQTNDYRPASATAGAPLDGVATDVILDATGSLAAVDAAFGTQAADLGIPAGFTDMSEVVLNSANNLTSCNNVDSLIVHQAVATKAMNAGLISCSCIDEKGSLLYTLNDGRPVTVVNDPLMKSLLEDGGNALGFGDTATAGTQYLSILYRRGAIHYGEGCHPKPLVVDSDECANNGAGEDCIIERRRFTVHPEGGSFIGTNGQGAVAATDGSATVAELGDPSHWDFAMPAERLPFKFIITDLG